MIAQDLAEASPERPVRVGRYDVTGLIRVGGMGTVYDAVVRGHGARVALKTLNHLSAASLRRFKSEFRAVADLSHPNLVALHELSGHDDLWFFTMERVYGADIVTTLRGGRARSRTPRSGPPRSARSAVGGPTLRNMVDPASERHPLGDVASPPRSIAELRAAFGQLVSGVGALHAAGLLHLDIKPSNVLVDTTGRVVLVDFGLVRPLEDDRAAEDRPQISGTPEWMAPEQYVGEGIGPATDWYAVGLLLYLALTGVPAFEPSSVELLAYAKLHAPPMSPRVLVPELPEDLATLAMALLDPDAAKRPTGQMVAAAFGADVASGGDAGAGTHVRSSLVGRASELAVLANAFASARRGEAALVHVIGTSGVGKTRLLESLADDAKRDAILLHGRCYERESVPYKAFDCVIDDLAALWTRAGLDDLVKLPAGIAELAEVFPVLAGVPAIGARLTGPAPDHLPRFEVRRRALQALRDLLAALAAKRPLVIVIDDLQWCDPDSATLLLRLVEPPGIHGLLVVVSFRALEAQANPGSARYLGAAPRAGSAAAGAIHRFVIEVGPLSPADARLLAAEALADAGHAPSDALAREIATESGGVPLYIGELARAASALGGGEGLDDRRLSVSLSEVLGTRMSALPRAERAIVEVLAVANNPIPLSVAFSAAGLDRGSLGALWALRAGQFVRAPGSLAEDRIELHHDRVRESVLAELAPARRDVLELEIGRALAAQESPTSWLFDTVRHLDAVPALLVGDERRRAADLNLEAGRVARGSAAFALAFSCFHAAATLLGEDGWTDAYEQTLAAHSGAAEAAYLSAEWTAIDAHVAEVKAHGRTVLEQLPAWEVQIDADIARRAYAAAVDGALDALALLGVQLPADPGDADIGVELKRATDALARVAARPRGPDAFLALPDAENPSVLAAMRIQARISSAAYFARPKLFPVIACRLLTTSAQLGLSPATPYALAVYGVVLNTLGQFTEAHAWGQVALRMLGRFPDRSLEPRTRHVIYDLVCVWTVPLASTLEDLRAVVTIGREIGDMEYAAYAAHAYVHNAFYAGRALGPLLEEALELGAFMRAHEQVNALHVHVPFERALRCFVVGAASLDGDGFDELSALEVAHISGSRSAECIVRLLMGLVRYHFGFASDAVRRLELARPFLDGVVSTWHVPIFHQYAALAIAALPPDERAELRARADESRAALASLAAVCPENFAHRVHLIDAEFARGEGDLGAAFASFQKAVDAAEANGFVNDAALAHELAARLYAATGDATAAAASKRAACEAYERWGAPGKAALLASTAT